MSILEQALLLSLLAGLAIPVGAIIACVERIQREWLEQELRHFIIAFGGGTLLAAVALILVPMGVEHLSIIPVIVCFMLGSFIFFIVDRWLAAREAAASQFLAMLIDFVPEAIALGAAFAIGDPAAFLLAFLITIQNLPEGFNAFREIQSKSTSSRMKILAIFVAVAFLGPLSAFLGVTFFSSNQALLGGIMLFSSGGILYLTFQDIAPAAKIERHWAPALGASGGFLLGLVGSLITHS